MSDLAFRPMAELAAAIRSCEVSARARAEDRTAIAFAAALAQQIGGFVAPPGFA
jgi:hypothetical protein